MKKSVIVAIVFGAVVLAAIILTTLGGSNSKYRVKVCMSFEGRTACRTVRASTHDEALRTATDNSCSELASGQSAFERCRNTRPVSEEWLAGE
jgi:hypothetical protein